MTGRTYVAPVSFGLGDLVVSLPAIQAVVAEGGRTGAETWLVTRSPAQALLAGRIDGLTGCVPEAAFDRSSSAARGDRVLDLRDHPLQRDHWWGSAEFEHEFGPLGINEILHRICVDLGIDADFTRPVALRSSPRPDVRDTVLLVAETDGPSKRWPAPRWEALAAGIRASGADVRRVVRSAGGDRADGGAGPLSIDEVVAPTPGDAVDVLTSCRAVIGVDTGLTHLAAQQGTVTITLSRAGNVFVRSWPHCRTVTGRRCDPECAALDAERAHNEQVDLGALHWEPLACPSGAGCLDPITPGEVLQVLRELL